MKKGFLYAFLSGVCCLSQAATTIDYTYDDLNRLEAVVRSDAPTLSYSYDEVGNITSMISINPDTDNDGLPDIAEINVYATNPAVQDTDLDGLSDGDEVNLYGTNPNNPDSDGDGISDGVEIANGTNPLNYSDPNPGIADGDLNLDGVVNIADILLGYQILNGQFTPTLPQLQHGDVAPLVNGFPAPDGTFGAGDLLVIIRNIQGQVVF